MGLYVDQLARMSPARVAMLTTLGDLQLRTGDIKAAEAAVDEAERLREIVGVPEWDDVGIDRTSGEIADAAGRAGSSNPDRGARDSTATFRSGDGHGC